MVMLQEPDFTSDKHAYSWLWSIDVIDVHHCIFGELEYTIITTDDDVFIDSVRHIDDLPF